MTAAVALAAAFWLCLLAVLALWTALQPAAARAEEPSGDIITVLQPGENLVGWIAAEAPVGDLFAAVPEIEAVWTWDAPGRRWRVASPRVPETFHSLRTLTPGMGLLIQLGGDQPVEWTRSAVPARGLVQLRPGPNLVAWAGPDDSKITWLSKGIGISLVSARLPSSGEAGWSLYDPADAATAETFPAINRGDALWVTSSRNINWLQPTGVLPKLEFPGGASQSLRNSARADLESMLEFYGENYAIHADFWDLTVYLPKDCESLHDVTGDSVQRCESGGAWAWPDAMVVRQSDGGSGSRRVVLSHEYFHVMQMQLAEGHFGDDFIASRNWLVEGTASWMQWRHSEAQGFDVQGFDRNQALAQSTQFLRSDRASLESSAEPYTHGLAASDLLAQRAGEGALIEFWRLLGPSSPTPSRAPWQEAFREAFREAFQVSETDFYSVFCRFRRGETVPDYDDDTLCLDDDVLIVSGVLLYDDGTAISGATVRVEPLDVELALGHYEPFEAAQTDSRGRFTLRFPNIFRDYSLRDPVVEIGERLGLRVEVNNGLCEGWYAAGSLADTPAAVPFDDGLADIQITVPSGTCRRIEGSVVGPDGFGLPGTEVVLYGRLGESNRSRTAPDGSFAFVASPRGRYQLAVQFDKGCHVVWFMGGDNVAASGADAGYSRLDDLDGVRVVVPENACRWSVRGRLVDSDGEGVADGWVSLQGKRSWFTDRSVRTGSDGWFEFVVPLPGEYQLSMKYPGCQQRPYYADDGGATFDRSEAALLALGAEDVSDLVLRFPDGACDDR